MCGLKVEVHHLLPHAPSAGQNNKQVPMIPRPWQRRESLPGTRRLESGCWGSCRRWNKKSRCIKWSSSFRWWSARLHTPRVPAAMRRRKSCMPASANRPRSLSVSTMSTSCSVLSSSVPRMIWVRLIGSRSTDFKVPCSPHKAQWTCHLTARYHCTTIENSAWSSWLPAKTWRSNDSIGLKWEKVEAHAGGSDVPHSSRSIVDPCVRCSAGVYNLPDSLAQHGAFAAGHARRKSAENAKERNRMEDAITSLHLEAELTLRSIKQAVKVFLQSVQNHRKSECRCVHALGSMTCCANSLRGDGRCSWSSALDGGLSLHHAGDPTADHCRCQIWLECSAVASALHTNVCWSWIIDRFIEGLQVMPETLRQVATFACWGLWISEGQPDSFEAANAAA